MDASPRPGEPDVIAGEFDFGALLARIEHAVKKVNAKRVSMAFYDYSGGRDRDHPPIGYGVGAEVIHYPHFLGKCG